MHIVHVTGLVSLKYGGLERHFVRLAEACARRGHRVTCVWERAPSNETFVRDLTAAGAASVALPARGRPAAFVAQFARWLRGQPCEVLHGHFNPAAVLALAVAAWRGVPVRVSTLHSGLTPREQTGLRLHNRLTTRARSLLCHRVLAVSQGVWDQFTALGLSRRKALLHYLGIEPPPAGNARTRLRQEFGIAPDAPVIVCAAFHDPVKGVDVLLRALALLRPAVPGMRLLEAGGSLDPRQTEDLHRLAAELGLGDAVVWAGQRNDMRAVLQAGDVYCQPSRSEGLPLAVLEAASAGLPVVASRVGGIPEAVLDGQTGLLVPPESPEALAGALKTLLGDPARRRELGKAGRERASTHFDLGRQTERLVDLYEALAASPAAHPAPRTL
jgi:glycosyltransferase involved in cell wall biosynthesis